MTTRPPDPVAQRSLAVSAAGWVLDLLAVAGVGFAAVRLAPWRWPIMGAQLAYGLGLGGVTWAAWWYWRSRAAAARAEPLAEPLRVLLVAAAALAVTSPMLTDRFLGGTDARWYAYMLHDFIEQWRTQGPPVFLGQGEHVWVGAVHPFRSAPVLLHVAGLWDWLTLGTLGTAALQNLTTITAALAGAWGAYATGVRVAPRMRWAAAGLAGLYALSPAVMIPLLLADAHMTYVAAAVFAWVMHGNVRVLTEGRGWTGLAAALSLAWMSHPPTAMQVTLISGVLQAGGLVLGRAGWRAWGAAAGAGGWFVLFSLYYFTGMSELPNPPDAELRRDLLQLLALAAGLLAGARALLWRDWWWGLVLAAAGAGLALVSKPWLAWLVLTLVLVALAGWQAHRRGSSLARDYAPLIVLGGLLLGAGLMDPVMRAGWCGGGDYPGNSALMWVNAWAENYFKPLSPKLLVSGDYQPGWGLWLAGGAAGLAACRRGARAGQLVFGAIVLMTPLILHWPRTGDFMVAYLPAGLTAMTGVTMALRVMPVYAALLMAGGCLALREAQERAAPVRWGVGVIVLLAVGWAGWEARLMVERGRWITAPREVSARDWRSENSPMDRFVYDLLRLPSYFSHGKMDPRLEARLLDDRGNLIYGPSQMVEAMEAAGAESIDLEAREIAGHPHWLQLEPRFTLQPGEHRLLRFEFDPARSYAGYLLFFSESGYREYRLPESGMRRAFGTGPGQARMISLWNSGTTAEHYHLQYLFQPGNDLQPGQPFARVTLTPFRPERALIRVESLNPWRVRTNMPWSGQLETPRVYLPGYEVRVDGRRIGPSRISASPDKLLQIAMPPGEHVVEVRFAGTWKLRAAGVVSLGAWTLLLVVVMAGRHWRATRRLAF